MTVLEQINAAVTRVCQNSRQDPLVTDCVMRSVLSDLIDAITAENSHRAVPLTDAEISPIARPLISDVNINRLISVVRINVETDQRQATRLTRMQVGWGNFWFAILTNVIGAVLYSALLLALYPIVKDEVQSFARGLVAGDRIAADRGGENPATIAKPPERARINAPADRGAGR